MDFTLFHCNVKGRISNHSFWAAHKFYVHTIFLQILEGDGMGMGIGAFILHLRVQIHQEQFFYKSCFICYAINIVDEPDVFDSHKNRKTIIIIYHNKQIARI